MGGSAKQLKPHNNLPGMNGNSLNPLKVSPGPGIPAPMDMPGMPGGSFNPMTQLRQLPGMGGGGQDAVQEEAQRLRAGMPAQMPGQLPAGMMQAGMDAMQGMQSADKMQRLGSAPVSSLMGGAQTAMAGGAPQMPAAPVLDPASQIAQGLGGAQSLAGTAAANEFTPGRGTGGGGGRKAMQQALNPRQAAKMAAKLGGGS